VKTLRILLVVLLAMLLPLRSALAVVVHCGQQEAPRTVSAVHEHAAQHHDVGVSVHEHEGAHALPDAAEYSAQDASPDEPSAALDGCGMGTASCSSAPLMGFGPGIVLPAALAQADFPSYLARVASFLVDGPDRPPRFV